MPSHTEETPASTQTDESQTDEPQPKFGEVNDIYVSDEANQDVEDVLIGGENSAGLWAGFAALFKMSAPDWSACFWGTFVGCIMSALVLPATMQAGLCPGLSQITLVMTCSMLFQLNLCNVGKMSGWFKLNEQQKHRYLLILQSAGSAPACLTFAIAVAIPAGMMIEKAERTRLGLIPEGEKWQAKDSLDKKYLIQIILVGIASSMTGAAWTNVNMARALKEEHQAPEARASASLIGNYSLPDERDEVPEKEGNDPEEASDDSDDKKKTGGEKVVWFKESFLLPAILAVGACLLIWAGFLPSTIKFKFWKATNYKAQLKNEWVEQTNWDYSPDASQFDLGGLTRNCAIFLAAYAHLTKWQFPKVYFSSSVLHCGIGALLNTRTTLCMVWGSVVCVAVCNLWPKFYYNAIKPSNVYEDGQLKAEYGGDLERVKDDLLFNARMWSDDNGNAYKWVGVTVILVYTVYIVINIARGESGTGKKNPMAGFTMGKFSWNRPFNIICFFMGYGCLLVLTFMFSSNVPFSLRIAYFLATCVLDYILNMIGGLQSLAIGGSCSPVSACLMVVAVVIGLLRTMELTVDSGDQFHAEYVPSDCRVYGLWFYRALTSIAYTNDAAQDYATTQLLKQNIYVATRQNLISAIVGSVVIPLSFAMFLKGDRDVGTDDGYECPQAAAFKTIFDGIKVGPFKGGMPWITIGISIVIAGVAMSIELWSKRPVRKNESGLTKIGRLFFNGFSCTGFALGIYLGTKTPLGTLFATLVCSFAMRGTGGTGREKNKELYMVAVAFIGGSAIQEFFKIALIIFQVPTLSTLWGWSVEKDPKMIEKWTTVNGTLTSTRTYQITSSNLAHVSSFKDLWIPGIGMVLALLFIVYINGRYGHEMEMAAPEMESSGEEQNVEETDEIELSLAKFSDLHGVSPKDPLFKKKVLAYEKETRDLLKANASLKQTQSRQLLSKGKLEGAMLEEGWRRRNAAEDDDSHRVILRNSAFAAMLAVILFAAFGYYTGGGSSKQWAVSSLPWSEDLRRPVKYNKLEAAMGVIDVHYHGEKVIER